MFYLPAQLQSLIFISIHLVILNGDRNVVVECFDLKIAQSGLYYMGSHFVYTNSGGEVLERV